MNLKQGRNNGATCIQKWTAGPDWFRTKLVGPKPVKEAIDAIRALQSEDANNGHALRRWRFQGYEGMASGSVRWGVRDWSLIWETSGEVTPFTMTRLQSFTGLGKRIDLQVTLDFTSPLEQFGSSLLGLIDRMKTRQRSSGRLVGESRRTDGFYCGTVGRRAHPRYWRLYDKGIESNTAPIGQKWRLELETKGTLAEDICKLPMETLTGPAFCARYLVSSWRSEGFSWPVREFADDVALFEPRKRPPSPAGPLLMWAQRTVSPVTQRLLAVFTVDEILEAYGLKDVATSRRSDNA